VRPASAVEILPLGSRFVVQRVPQQVWPRAGLPRCGARSPRPWLAWLLGDLPLGVFFVRGRDLARGVTRQLDPWRAERERRPVFWALGVCVEINANMGRSVTKWRVAESDG